MPTVLRINWALYTSVEAFYDDILKQMDAPIWHGKNLDALDDSLVTGDICKAGPPFTFQFINEGKIRKELVSFAQAVKDIARVSNTQHGG